MTKFIPVAFALVAFGSSLTTAFAGASNPLEDRVSAQQATLVQTAPVAAPANVSHVATFTDAEAYIVNQNARQH